MIVRESVDNSIANVGIVRYPVVSSACTRPDAWLAASQDIVCAQGDGSPARRSERVET